MSREPSSYQPKLHAVTPRRVAGALVIMLAVVAAGCGRDTTKVGRAGTDSVWHAPGAQPGSGSVTPPTPGFTSAQGTPAGKPAPAVAPAAVAAAMAPPPSAALERQLGVVEQQAIASLPPGAGHDLVVGNCLICHAATMIEQQHKDTTAWNKTVTQMVAWGAPVPKSERSVLIAYLAEHYPARAAGAPARQVP